jgi:hypothetical protein
MLSCDCVCTNRGAGLVETGQAYDRFPAIHGDTIAFAAEGDLWKVAVGGGNCSSCDESGHFGIRFVRLLPVALVGGFFRVTSAR